jgi:hypothetical protein
MGKAQIPTKRTHVKGEPKPRDQAMAWRRRVDFLLGADVARAKETLSRFGFTPDQAIGHVQSHGLGAFRMKPDAPSEFSDPTNDCYWALQMLLLQSEIEASDPGSLQIGRLWGFAVRGMGYRETSKAVQGWWLGNNRGPGGRKESDLTSSLRTALERHPKANCAEVCTFLASDEAEYLFSALVQPTIQVTAVEVDTQAKSLTYDDRVRETHKISFASIDRKLRRLRRG